MTRLRIVVHGAAGRMGMRVIALTVADPDLELTGAVEFATHPRLGDDAGIVAGVGSVGIPISSSLPTHVDAVIDFSVPSAAMSLVDACVAKGTPVVVATTGLTAEQKHRIGAAAEKIPVVWSPNMSLAVNLTMKLAGIAAGTLNHYPGGVDVEIVERHHRFKEDAPSGTALRFGEIISGIMGHSAHQHGRAGMLGRRPRHEIGYHAQRVGDCPGEHTIIFGMLGETIELVVKASNRDCYAAGALSAARFVAGRKPGLYSMYDVLDLP